MLRHLAVVLATLSATPLVAAPFIPESVCSRYVERAVAAREAGSSERALQAYSSLLQAAEWGLCPEGYPTASARAYLAEHGMRPAVEPRQPASRRAEAVPEAPVGWAVSRMEMNGDAARAAGRLKEALRWYEAAAAEKKAADVRGEME